MKTKLGTVTIADDVPATAHHPVEPAEAINHPSHYQGEFECIDVMRAMFGDADVMAFCRLNVYKYRRRAGLKNGTEDIKKAEWYERYLVNMRREISPGFAAPPKSTAGYVKEAS